MEPVVHFSVMFFSGIVLFFAIIGLVRAYFHNKRWPKIANWQLRKLHACLFWHIGFLMGLMQSLRAGDMLLMNGNVESSGWMAVFDWTMITINFCLVLVCGVMVVSNLFDASCRCPRGMRATMIRDKY